MYFSACSAPMDAGAKRGGLKQPAGDLDRWLLLVHAAVVGARAVAATVVLGSSASARVVSRGRCLVLFCC